MKLIKKLCRIGIHDWVFDYSIIGREKIIRKCRQCEKKQYKTDYWGWVTGEEFDKKINDEKENKKFIHDTNRT